jgi:predicted small secreted protein
MLKKSMILFALSVFVILIAGCETVKGAAQGAAEGVKKDWQTAVKADAWVKKNLW